MALCLKESASQKSRSPGLDKGGELGSSLAVSPPHRADVAPLCGSRLCVCRWSKEMEVFWGVMVDSSSHTNIHIHSLRCFHSALKCGVHKAGQRMNLNVKCT